MAEAEKKVTPVTPFVPAHWRFVGMRYDTRNPGGEGCKVYHLMAGFPITPDGCKYFGLLAEVQEFFAHCNVVIPRPSGTGNDYIHIPGPVEDAKREAERACGAMGLTGSNLSADFEEWAKDKVPIFYKRPIYDSRIPG